MTKEPVLLARMLKGDTVVCSIELDDQQPHASPDESNMDIDSVSITGTDDDAMMSIHVSKNTAMTLTMARPQLPQ